jgi:hypothetical protein
VEPVARGAELGSRKVSMAVRDRALVPGWPLRWLALGPVYRQNEGSSGLRAEARTLLATCESPTAGYLIGMSLATAYMWSCSASCNMSVRTLAPDTVSRAVLWDAIIRSHSRYGLIEQL